MIVMVILCLFDDVDYDADSVLVFFCKHGNEGMDLAVKRQANVTKLSSFIIGGEILKKQKANNLRNWGFNVQGIFIDKGELKN